MYLFPLSRSTSTQHQCKMFSPSDRNMKNPTMFFRMSPMSSPNILIAIIPLKNGNSLFKILLMRRKERKLSLWKLQKEKQLLLWMKMNNHNSTPMTTNLSPAMPAYKKMLQPSKNQHKTTDNPNSKMKSTCTDYNKPHISHKLNPYLSILHRPKNHQKKINPRISTNLKNT